MRVLVTGSAGRIGRKTVEALLARGDEVCGFDLAANGIVHPLYSETVGDFQDRAAAERAVAGADAVLHLGAFMSWRREDRDRLFSANVEGTRVVLEAAAAAAARRFVFASSGEVYPENNPERLPIAEDHPLKPNTVYGLTKLLGEELVRFHGRTGGFETVILRFSHTQDAAELLDPESFFSGPRFFLRARIRQQESFGNTAAVARLKAADPGREALVLARSETGRPFRMHITDTRDMVKGLLLSLDKVEAADGTFNLGATEPVDFPALLGKMSEITGLPVVTVDLPGPGVWYETSNRKIRETLGYEPEWTIGRMLAEAAETWSRRKAR